MFFNFKLVRDLVGERNVLEHGFDFSGEGVAALYFEFGDEYFFVVFAETHALDKSFGKELAVLVFENVLLNDELEDLEDLVDFVVDFLLGEGLEAFAVEHVQEFIELDHEVGVKVDHVLKGLFHRLADLIVLLVRPSNKRLRGDVLNLLIKLHDRTQQLVRVVVVVVLQVLQDLQALLLDQLLQEL